MTTEHNQAIDIAQREELFRYTDQSHPLIHLLFHFQLPTAMD